ncbi:MAG: hypothetical protein GDA53_04200 [Rhodobacteraceae bacterium]|nr:hypothetical protein [Paracoccaceae bacterium]
MRPGFAIGILSGALAFGSGMSAEIVSLSTAITETCRPMAEDEKNCIYFAGCITPEDSWFHGEARKWKHGEVILNQNDGVICKGGWDFRTAVNSGRTSIICSSGEKVEMSFFVRGADGTALSGKGISSLGRQVTMYGGPGAADYLKTRKDTDYRPEFSCGTVTIRLKDRP